MSKREQLLKEKEDLYLVERILSAAAEGDPPLQLTDAEVASVRKYIDKCERIYEHLTELVELCPKEPEDLPEGKRKRPGSEPSTSASSSDSESACSEEKPRKMMIREMILD